MIGHVFDGIGLGLGVVLALILSVLAIAAIQSSLR